MTKTLAIPDKWILGFLQGERIRGNAGVTVADAVRHWLDQEDMERQVQARRESVRKRLKAP